jgi:hypothetical protein
MPVPPRQPRPPGRPDRIPEAADTDGSIPLSVWATATPSPPGTTSPDYASRLVATYSRAGQTILLTATDPILTAAARYVSRTVITWPITDPRETGPTGRFHAAGYVMSALGQAADLIIDRPPPQAAADLLARFLGLAGMLRPGGYLLTVHTPTAGPLDPMTASIAAARAAGLRYLQHLILLAVPITGGQLGNPTGDKAPPDRLLIPAHTDMAVFTSGGTHA